MKRTMRRNKKCSTVTITAQIKNTTLYKFAYYRPTLKCVHMRTAHTQN